MAHKIREAFDHSRAWAWAILLTIWALMAAAANPLGNFPLNDDWAYAAPVVSLVKYGSLEFSGWGAPNLISQVLWGYAFVWLFGFSFTVLRVSTLLLAPVAILSTYEISRENNMPGSSAILTALLLACNPIFFVLSNTFMSDVPFCAFALLAFCLLLRGARLNSPAHYGLGIFFAIAALLTRQLGLALFIGLACAYLAKEGFARRHFLSAFGIVALGLGVQKGYALWLEMSHRTPISYGSQIHQLTAALQDGPRHIVLSMLKQGIVILIYLGLFASPFIITHGKDLLSSLKEQTSRWQRGLLFSLFAIALFCLGPAHICLPILGNVLTKNGVGPLTLRDTYFLGAADGYSLPSLFWRMLTAAGAGGGLAVLVCLFFIARRFFQPGPLREKFAQHWRLIFICVMASAYVFPLSLIYYYDRYLIFLIPLPPLLIYSFIELSPKGLIRPHGAALGLASLLMVAACGFSVSATHDYLSWNRARWTALRGLLTKGVAPAEIDGGFEFNGWFLYSAGYTPSPAKSWWWVDGDKYIISFSPIGGYRELGSVPFSPWLPANMDRVRVLEREK